ncbi:MAG TPA: hemerythrin domain-containing protein [Thermoanaerobaculia bacterium]|nr:hemerythrin domain-containing protein [Thermoanaerobaculia bacterium]
MSDLHDFLSRDHARLDALLETCMRADRNWQESYEAFRRGLLRHISIEERVLFPELRKRRGTTSLEQKLHRDHAALAALLVPPPSPAEIRQIAAILTVHNELEERAGGLYDDVESLSGDELSALMARVHAIPPVRVAPHFDSPLVRNTIEQLVREAAATHVVR